MNSPGEDSAAVAVPVLRTTQQWRDYLRDRSELSLPRAIEGPYRVPTASQVAQRWLGFAPADEEAVTVAEGVSAFAFPRVCAASC